MFTLSYLIIHKINQEVIMLPSDPVILLSYINTKLRDYYSSLDELCDSLFINKDQLILTLQQIDYTYSELHNQFIWLICFSLLLLRLICLRIKRKNNVPIRHPNESIITSTKDPLRPGTKIWCISSVMA